jgi:glutamate racemase
MSSETTSSGPIGIFDSGVGGVSVLRHIRTRLPAEDLIYCADSAFAPYGSKTPEFIGERSMAIARFLIEQGAKALVVACNTATAASIAMLRGRLVLPIIGMEPAVKPAAAATRSGVIGVLATVGTLKSARFAGLLESYGSEVKIVTQGCPGLVEQIEAGELTSDETARLVEKYLAPLLAAGADTIVLGCTHYPFVRPLISQLAGPGVQLIDTGGAVARQLENRLVEQGLLLRSTSGGACPGQTTFYSNTPTPEARQVIERLWGEPASELKPLPV